MTYEKSVLFKDDPDSLGIVRYGEGVCERWDIKKWGWVDDPIAFGAMAGLEHDYKKISEEEAMKLIHEYGVRHGFC